MASFKSHISWTHSTWNPTTGCTKVSAGCDHCYAEALTNRLFGGGFENMKLHPERLAQARKFTPLLEDGVLKPRMVFVNSMSDLLHEAIPDSFRDRVFDAMAEMPFTVFQILTKRPMTLRRYIEERFKASGVPTNIWLGVSVEDNRVKGRIDMLRRLKDAVGAFTAFLSVEPLIGAIDQHDYTNIDQVLIGGESGPQARPMDVAWARAARDLALEAGAAVWFKQFGTWPNNPLYRQAPGPTHLDRVRQAIEAGEREVAIIVRGGERGYVKGEKGGGTLDGRVWHQLPAAYEALAAKLTQ